MGEWAGLLCNQFDGYMYAMVICNVMVYSVIVRRKRCFTVTSEEVVVVCLVVFNLICSSCYYMCLCICLHVSVYLVIGFIYRIITVSLHRVGYNCCDSIATDLFIFNILSDRER